MGAAQIEVAGGGSTDVVFMLCSEMPRRSSRFASPPPDMIADVLREVEACRNAMIKLLLSQVKPFSPAYKAGLDVLDAIDGVAEVLTGDRTHFHDRGTRYDPRQGD